MNRKKTPITIMYLQDLVYFLQKNDLAEYTEDLVTYLQTKKVKKHANEIIDGLLEANLMVNEKDSAEYFHITAQALVSAKRYYVGIKNPTFITSSSTEAKFLKKYVEWGEEHRKFLLSQGEEHTIERYFTALGTEICRLAWIKKHSKEVFLKTIINKREALMANTEIRLKITVHKKTIAKFQKDFVILSKSSPLSMDDKLRLQDILINAIILYESHNLAFNYEHFLAVLSIRKNSKVYYFMGEKTIQKLASILRGN